MRRAGLRSRLFLMGALVAPEAWGGSQPETAPPRTPETTIDASTYIPDNAELVVYLDQEQLRTSFYAPYLRRLWKEIGMIGPSTHGEILEKCSQLWLGVGPEDLDNGRDRSVVFGGRGSCAKELAAEAGADTAAEGHFEDQAFVFAHRTAPKAPRPSTFDTAGAALAVRGRAPAMGP